MTSFSANSTTISFTVSFTLDVLFVLSTSLTVVTSFSTYPAGIPTLANYILQRWTIMSPMAFLTTVCTMNFNSSHRKATLEPVFWITEGLSVFQIYAALQQLFSLLSS